MADTTQATQAADQVKTALPEANRPSQGSLDELIVQATPEAEWRKGYEPELVKLPSGRKIVGRQIRLSDLLWQRTLPGRLLQAIEPVPGGKIVIEHLQQAIDKALQDPVVQRELADSVCRAGFVYPRISPPLTEPKPGEIALADISPLDRIAFYQWALVQEV